jgi:hypothetical protein
MDSMSANERLERFQLHAAKCQRVNVERPRDCEYSIDSCLFRVVYDTSNRSTFIPGPEFAPLAYPAFIAGCQEAPNCIEMQILHCGGESCHRESTPYISCSRDLLWCLLSSAVALIQGTASNVQIWFIDNTRTHHDIQYDVWREEHWDEHSRNVQIPDIDTAREQASSSTEVLVYKRISRERVLGVLKLDLEKTGGAPAGFGQWAQETLEKTWSYPVAVCEFFLEDPGGSDDLVEWCENNLEITACTEDICRVCPVDAIYMALHPLSRDHVFTGDNGVEMKSKLHDMFEWYDDDYWRLKYTRKHQDSHERWLDEDNIYAPNQKEAQWEVIGELVLDSRMEALGLGTPG